MATASNSPPAPIQSQNSPRSRHSRRSSAARGSPSLSDSSSPPSLSGTLDQDQFVASSFSTPSDSVPSEEARASVAAASCLTQDVSASAAAAAASDGGGADSQLENSDNGGANKKPAWNKPSNGAVAEVGAVMGADSWPALSESARASPKTSLTDSPKALSHGSLTLSQGTSVGSLSPQTEVVNTSIKTTNSTSNHVIPTRQRSMKRGGGSSSHSSMTANGSLSQAPPVQVFVVDVSPSNLGKSGGSVGESPRDNTHRDAGQRGGSYGGNEPHQQRGSFRRSNSGPQPRGDGSYHHGHGGRRELERGKQDWANNRSFGSRENLTSQQRVGSRPFIRGPVSNAPFIPAPPPPIAVRPFVPPMVYTEMPSPVFYVPGPHPDSLRPVSMLPMTQMFYSIPDPLLPSKIVSQIDYYFSSENLVRDTFLRQNMDGDGWVPISLIATFKKVAQLTDNIQLILDAVQSSNVVEVQGDKVRRKNDWNKWIIPPVQYSTGTSPQSLHKSNQDMLAAHIKNVTLDEKAAT